MTIHALKVTESDLERAEERGEMGETKIMELEEELKVKMMMMLFFKFHFQSCVISCRPDVSTPQLHHPCRQYLLRFFRLLQALTPLCLQVACYIRIGVTTGAIDRTNYLCILSNNLFNQKYFLVLWLWWFALIGVSVLGLIYRFARIMIPDLSR